MTFAQLAVVGVAALLGPLLAWRRSWNVPLILGELIAGIVLGRTGFGYLDSSDVTFTFLANIGFALMMFVAGTHVPVRDARLRPAIPRGALRAVIVGVAAAILGTVLSHVFDTGHVALYTVLLASSSAALVLPIVDSLGIGGAAPVIGLLPQVAIADAVCIVALPMAIDQHHVLRAAAGSVCVIAATGVIAFILWAAEHRGLRKRIHRISESRLFAIELRVQIIILASLAAIAVYFHVSIMLAGFAFGIAVAAIGEPRRLAKQLFALSDGFLSPLFLVWLGASLDVRGLGAHPAMLGLGVALGLGAVLTHLVPSVLPTWSRRWGRPEAASPPPRQSPARPIGTPQPTISLGLLSAAQLGVPVAATTVGNQLGLFKPGEDAALLLGALITVGIATLGGALVARGLDKLSHPPDAGPSTHPTK